MYRTPPPTTNMEEQAQQPCNEKAQTVMYIENTPKASGSNITKRGTFETKRAVFDRTSADSRTTTQRSPPVASKQKVGPPPALNHTVTVRRSAGDGQKDKKIRSRYADAKERLQEAKELLGMSRNLKTEVKNGVIEILEKLVQYVREVERENAGQKPVESVEPSTKLEIPQLERLKSMMMAHSEMLSSSREQNERLEEALTNHASLLQTVDQYKAQMQQSLIQMKNLEGVVRYHSITLEKSKDNSTTTPAVKANAELLQEVRELKSTTQELSKRVEQTNCGPRTYAEMAAQSRPRIEEKAHAIVVSTINNDSSNILMDEVRDTVKARDNGIKIQKMKRVRGPKIVLSCATKKELDYVADSLRKNVKLVVENAKYKNPLVVLKNICKRNTEADITAALARQNAELAEGLSAEEAAVTERYRRRARHPDECHVVLQVSPKLWQRLTAAGRLFVDVQCIRVQDQTPLIQCMRCLGYGHGRKTCAAEEEDRCTKCGQAGHTKKDCDQHASCRNCEKAKLPHSHHDVFSDECPIRARADALAREAVAYA